MRGLIKHCEHFRRRFQATCLGFSPTYATYPPFLYPSASRSGEVAYDGFPPRPSSASEPCKFSSYIWSGSHGDVASRAAAADDRDCRPGDESEDDGSQETGTKQFASGDPGFVIDVQTIIEILLAPSLSVSQTKEKLEQCGVRVSSDLVGEVLSRTRNDCESAFSFFEWAGEQPGYSHSAREYHAMISILGKARKFETAWALINDMRDARKESAPVTPRTLLIMIVKYCAVHDVDKAVSTFHAYRQFGFEAGMEEFQNLLCALCRHKNVKEAEQLLLGNARTFPLNTKSFNIVLNGWCAVLGGISQGKRIWREMQQRGIPHDAFSYSSMISCYSQAGNSYAVLKLFSQMKEMGVEPDRKVYNAVIFCLAKCRLVKEACDIVEMMEQRGVTANTVTYNSLLMPLCRSSRLGEAREVLNEMLQRGLSPTFRTYHAFLKVARTQEEVFELLEQMRATGCPPIQDTYIMLIRKFCRWRQLNNVFKLWTAMRMNGLSPDRSSYVALIHGLFLNGELEESYKFYLEMKEKLLVPEPNIEKVLQAWLTGRTKLPSQMKSSDVVG